MAPISGCKKAANAGTDSNDVDDVDDVDDDNDATATPNTELAFIGSWQQLQKPKMLPTKEDI